MDGLKLAQAIVQHGDYVAAAKGREGESGTGHVQPEQPIITSGPDPKFRYVVAVGDYVELRRSLL